MYDLIIIGGGPAGLTAAVYARRKQLDVLMISLDLGGKTNYRLQMPHLDQPTMVPGEAIVHQFIAELQSLGCTRDTDRVTQLELAADGFEAHTQQGQVHSGRAVIVATGSHAQPLDVPGEAEFLMRGLAYSALSYAPVFTGQTAVVIGDSTLALQSTAELARTAQKVTLIMPTPADLSSPLAQRLLDAQNVVIWQGYQVIRVNGNRYARSLTIRKDDTMHEVAADGFFVELGLRPNSAFAAGVVTLSANGAIRVDCRCRTTTPGLFAAGDVTDIGVEQVLIALGDGTKAALSAYEYLLELPVRRASAPMTEEWR